MKSTEILHKLVKAEAKKLKENAFKKELDNLDIDTLCPINELSCIYGQMTGTCTSERADKLMRLSCTRIYIPSSEGVKGTLNGDIKDIKKKRCHHIWDSYEYFSPVEIFIAKTVNQNNGNNKALIAYLKGETKTLTFK